jgi:hypothetical protein
MALFLFTGAATMDGNPFESEEPQPPADRPAAADGDAAVHAEMRAAHGGEEGEQSAEETIDEPGYGHGV